MLGWLLELVGLLVVGWLLDEVGLLVLGVEFEELLDVGLEVLSPELLVGSWVSEVGSLLDVSDDVVGSLDEFEELLVGWLVVGSLVGSWVSLEVGLEVSEFEELSPCEVCPSLRMSWLSVMITAISSVLPSPISTLLSTVDELLDSEELELDSTELVLDST